MRPCAVIFDRDGTLVFDVPYNGDPSLVQPVGGVAEALGRVRAAGIPTAVVSNQSGVARGLISIEQVEAVNRRVDELLGPFDAWQYCPHGEDDNCDCRKPKPKMLLDAARDMDVDPSCCVMIGDKQSDVEAARNAGMRAIFIERPQMVIEAIERVLALLA